MRAGQNFAKRVNILLNILTTHTQIIIILIKGEETLVNDGYVYGFDGDDGFMMYTYTPIH